jgi:hypothetical protein
MKKIIVIGVLALLAFGGVGCSIDQNSKLGKVSEKLHETEKQLDDANVRVQKLETSLNEAMNLVKNEAFKNQFPLIPESVIIEKCLDKEAISEMIARATLPIVYSISTPSQEELQSGYARSGRVVILGKENNRYVGFTTLCTVSLERPWPITIKPEDKCNEVIIVGDKRTGLEWYKVKKDNNYIRPDMPIAAAYVTESLIDEPKEYTLTLNANQDWQSSNIKMNKGDEITVAVSGKWRTSQKLDYCDPDGYNSKGDYPFSKDTNDFPLGALIGTSDKRSGEFFYVGNKHTFGSDIEGESLSFKINERGGVLKDNDGFVTIRVLVKKRNASEKLNDIVLKGKEVIIAPIGKHDMALVYFPISEETIFGKKEIYTLGLNNPTEEATKLIEKGDKFNVFGTQFVGYCEQCHQAIQQVQLIIDEEKQKAYKEGYEVGKIEGKKELVSGVVRYAVKGVMWCISLGLSELLPDKEMCEIITPIAQSIAMDYLDNKWPAWSKKIEQGMPELRGTLPKSLSELLPNIKLAPEDMMTSVSKGIYKLAGIEGFDNLQVQKFISSLLKDSQQVTWLPTGKNGAGNEEGHLLVNGQYINQLLVSLGMAKVSKSDKESPFPFMKEMKQTEQKAKDNKIGVWKQ